MSFDLGNPKIFLGLLIGGFLPYLLTETPTTVTKWLVFSTILRHLPRPSVLRLCGVAVAEALCFYFVTILFLAGHHRLPVPVFLSVAVAVYSGLATFPNLLLFPSASKSRGRWTLRRIAFAFGSGLVYLGYVLIVVLLWSLFRL